MGRDEIISKLRAHEAELRAAGVLSLALIGSFARNDAREDSDVDVVVRLADDPTARGFRHIGRLDALTRQLESILGRPVDVITEPVRKDGLRRQIEKERALAF
jgi:predicted nucleotidyltransferase